MILRVEIQLLASQLQTKGAHRVERLDERAAAAMHTGSGDSINPKHWVCEDSLTVARLADGAYLAAVADAHWGGTSGEAIAGGLRAAWDATEGTPRASVRLHKALLAIEAQFLGSRSPDDPSETTALLVHLCGTHLSFASVGDSLLIVVGRDGNGTPRVALRNQLSPFFLGVQPLATLPGSPIDSGTLALESGDVVLLASDGLEPEASRLEPHEVAAELTAAGPLEDRVRRIMELANDPARRAGRDNLALVALSVG